ncbi:hypothetical protein HOV93_39980 [Planctomycetes bacterium FF15]|uniref:Uncharacterized protein n=1 Tax=Bremerella alba TaxID=980252 RepID=A0A7V8V8G8_9BACT|nr:hypothetical protein [Bremerella alba]
MPVKRGRNEGFLAKRGVTPEVTVGTERKMEKRANRDFADRDGEKKPKASGIHFLTPARVHRLVKRFFLGALCDLCG